MFKNGYKVFERYYGGATSASLANLASVTKSITSALVGQAIERGILEGVDQKIEPFYPEYFVEQPVDDARKRTLTIRHLLTMSAGFQWNEDWESGDSVAVRWWYSNDKFRFALALRLLTAPGEAFNYNTSVAHLLSGVITRTSGLPMAEFARRYLFSNLGITNFYWPVDSMGYNLGGSELRLAARDLAKFGYLYLKDGYWEDGTAVRPEWVWDSLATQISHSSGWFGRDYGYLWWLDPLHGDFRYPISIAAGLGGQYAFLWRDLDLLMVATAICPGNGNGQWQPVRVARDFVSRAGEANPPAVVSVTPRSARPGESVTLTLLGAGLLDATISAGCGLTVAMSETAPDRAKAMVQVPDGAVPGACPLTVRNGRGAATADFAVAPAFDPAGIVNAATFQPGLAPGALATVFAYLPGVGPEQARDVPLPRVLAGIEVRLNGIAAPLLYAGPNQVNFQVPLETPPGAVAALEIVRNGAVVYRAEAAISAAAPGAFESNGTAIITDLAYRLVGPQNPLRAGQTYTVWVNGLGAVTAAVETGAGAPLDARASVPVSLTVGGREAMVLWAGLSPGWVGLYQVNFTMPEAAGDGVLRWARAQLRVGEAAVSFRTAVR